MTHLNDVTKALNNKEAFLYIIHQNDLYVSVCDPPLSPSNGRVDISVDKMTATFACDLEYTLVGMTTATCQNNSSGWNTSVPKCGMVILKTVHWNK